MFGIQFIKADPTVYLMQYRNGRAVRQGPGLSFFYFAPTTSLVAVPMGSVDLPFIFKEGTGDYQEVTVQGQIVYRIGDPEKLASMLNFTLDSEKQKYVSDDPEKIPARIVNLVQVLFRNEVQGIPMRDVLKASEKLVTKVRAELTGSTVMASLGIDVLDLSVIAIKPTPETARALEAGVREQLLKEADEAIYGRRNAAIQQERAIKENELNTEIAVEVKKRQIRETQMDAERAVQEKQRLLRDEDMTGNISLEQRNRELVQLSAENARVESDAKAYSMAVIMDAMAKIDPKVLNSLASMGMQPNQLIAASFRELAGSAAKIGELNISPDLLRELAKQSK